MLQAKSACSKDLTHRFTRKSTSYRELTHRKKHKKKKRVFAKDELPPC